MLYDGIVLNMKLNAAFLGSWKSQLKSFILFWFISFLVPIKYKV